ncbi:ATP-binding protein [Oceanispirochaeta sp.]|uniref:ATP-binding protein n=1 Tax=Oceanispirochaeta sp. TaxID=2035350 RepID=UPI002633B41F|nr:ATP-binding protein [Oceanispirochaeta sp.]MDA3958278.1 ATP-binding protein [Oceanispirochaeta sp.]
MIERRLQAEVNRHIHSFPVVALSGPRQCGKSTLAKMIISHNPESWIYLDLERPSDLRKLDDPELFFKSTGSKQVCIDEVQLRPELFPVLRSIVDEKWCNGQILLLGSASPELLRQGSETLAGRISFLELTPFTVSEISEWENYKDQLLKGGFPRSLLSDDDLSFLWRENFLKTYVERDLISLGFQLSSMQVIRLLKMCAHSQGQLFNTSKISESLGVSRATVNRWIDILQQTFMLRRLEPFESNIKKRLIKSPKLYIRDCGILHGLLEIRSFQNLLGHPVLGNSWEGYAIENILSENRKWQGSFYRTSQGAEIDLILSTGLRHIALEFKVSLAPKVSRGFWTALDDIKPESAWVIIPEGEKYPLRENVWVISLDDFLKLDILAV